MESGVTIFNKLGSSTQIAKFLGHGMAWPIGSASYPALKNPGSAPALYIGREIAKMCENHSVSTIMSRHTPLILQPQGTSLTPLKNPGSASSLYTGGEEHNV